MMDDNIPEARALRDALEAMVDRLHTLRNINPPRANELVAAIVAKFTIEIARLH